MITPELKKAGNKLVLLKIEKDAYLIHAEDHTVRIQVDEPGLSYDSRHQ